MNTMQEAATKADCPKHMRRLDRNELVRQGDLVRYERRGLKTWEGPGGFRADSFVHPIYRSRDSRAAKAEPR